MRRILSILVALSAAVTLLMAALASAAPAAPAAKSDVTITLVTHDSFAVSKRVLSDFTKETGITVKLLPAGDAGAALNQVILTKGAPIGDLLFGVDNTYLSRALKAGIFAPYKSPQLASVPATYQLDAGHHVTPVDHGDVCVEYDKQWFASHKVPVPSALEDLAKPAYKNLLVAENPSTLLHKISEIYDRIAFAGVGKYNEFENLRIAGIRHADVKGYSYSRGDVTAKALANAYSQALGNIFTQDIKPFEVEVLVAEVGDANGARNEIYHILYDGTIEDERNYAAMGGQSDEIRRFLKDHHKEGMPLNEALQLGVRALTVTQNKTLTEKDLEVAVLDRTKARRKFRRIPLEALGQLLGTTR